MYCFPFHFSIRNLRICSTIFLNFYPLNTTPTKLLLSKLDSVLQSWTTNLEEYSADQLFAKPTLADWSIGQLYLHLIETTTFHLEQVVKCLSERMNEKEEAAPEAIEMFLNNEFPDTKIVGSSSNDNTPQPINMEELVEHLMNLRAQLKIIADHFLKAPSQGKTRHPGLEYFSAIEWLKFSEMHLRHHLRQKIRIDRYLKQSGIR